jgi:hypothetical protein
MSYSGEYLDGVLLNLHAAAAPIPSLAAAHLLIYGLFLDSYARWEAFDDDRKTPAMRLTGG